MSLSVHDVLGLVEKMAPTSVAEPWDNPGLQVGSPSQQVRKVLVALDPTLETIKAAAGREAQLVITHHPLLFRPVSLVDISAYPGKVIFEILKSGISLAAAHTNLDAANNGINQILAELLELQEIEVLKPNEKSGIGRVGNLEKPVSLSEMADTIKYVFDAPLVGVVGEEGAVIRRVAVVGGSGGDFISLASQKGADVLLTGDAGHHQALEAKSMGLSLIDGGHFYTERAALRAFSGRLESELMAQGWEVSLEYESDEEAPMRWV